MKKGQITSLENLIVLGKIKALKSGDGVSEMCRLYSENQKLEWHWTLKNNTKNGIMLSKLYRNMVSTLESHTHPTIKYEGGGKTELPVPFQELIGRCALLKQERETKTEEDLGYRKHGIQNKKKRKGVPRKVVKAPPREMSP